MMPITGTRVITAVGAPVQLVVLVMSTTAVGRMAAATINPTANPTMPVTLKFKFLYTPKNSSRICAFYRFLTVLAQVTTLEVVTVKSTCIIVEFCLPAGSRRLP